MVAETNERLEVSYTNKSERFFQKKQEFSRQFFNIYFSRLSTFSTLLESKIKDKWGSKYPVKKLCDLNEDCPEQIIVVGTLFKHQELKPSILREISEDHQLAPLPPRTNYADDEDILILEDELQRIRLVGKIDIQKMVTGVVVAVLGYVEGDGRFMVEDFIFYESGPELPLKVIDKSPLVVLISGLDLSHAENIPLSLELFQQWIYGNFEMPVDKKSKWNLKASNIVRVIIAGNSVSSTIQKQMKNMSTTTSKIFDTSDMLSSIKVLDDFVSNLTRSVEVDLMPGEFDPSNYMMPQQPIHHCMFPKSSVCKSFNGVPNPYQCEIEGRLILGTSGQNIQDIERYSKIEDPLECLRSTIQWAHIAPTCPDTLPCYPYHSQDPFVITDCPHVYFAGNTPEFKTELYQSSNNQNIRLICIPAFHKTQTIALLNLQTLDCQSLSFAMTETEDLE